MTLETSQILDRLVWYYRDNLEAACQPIPIHIPGPGSGISRLIDAAIVSPPVITGAALAKLVDKAFTAQ